MSLDIVLRIVGKKMENVRIEKASDVFFVFGPQTILPGKFREIGKIDIRRDTQEIADFMEHVFRPHYETRHIQCACRKERYRLIVGMRILPGMNSIGIIELVDGQAVLFHADDVPKPSSPPRPRYPLMPLIEQLE